MEIILNSGFFRGLLSVALVAVVVLVTNRYEKTQK